VAGSDHRGVETGSNQIVEGTWTSHDEEQTCQRANSAAIAKRRSLKEGEAQDNRCRAVHEGHSRIKRRIQEVGSSKTMRASESGSPIGRRSVPCKERVSEVGLGHNNERLPPDS
jgi:hypothetical protein